MATVADTAMEVAAEVVHRPSRPGISISIIWLTAMVLVTFRRAERALSSEQEQEILRAVTELHQPEVAAAYDLEVHSFTPADQWGRIEIDRLATEWGMPGGEPLKLQTGIIGGPTVLVSLINPPRAEIFISDLVEGEFIRVGPSWEVRYEGKNQIRGRLSSLLSHQAKTVESGMALEQPVAQILRGEGMEVLAGPNVKGVPTDEPKAKMWEKRLGGRWSDFLVLSDGVPVSNWETRNRSREVINAFRIRDREIFERLANHGIPSVMVTAMATQKFKSEVEELGGVVIEIEEFVAPDYQTKMALDLIGMPWPVTWTLGPGPRKEIRAVATQTASRPVEGMAKAMALAEATEAVTGSSARLERGRPRSREASRERVLALRAEGLSQAEIARQMGKSDRWVRELVKGEGAFDRGRPTPTSIKGDRLG